MPAPVPSRIVVHPGPGLRGSFRPPGDKSITHRAYLIGALAEGVSRIRDPNRGADCESTLACLESLGVDVGRESSAVTVRGRAMRLEEPERPLNCGNSGTSMRLLAGVLAAQPFLSILVGDHSLHRRPMDRLVEPLRRMGAEIWARDQNRRPPLAIRGGPLRPIEHRVASQSAQVASCVLLAGLFASGPTTVWLGPARDHTERMLPLFGVPVEWSGAEGSAEVPRRVSGPALPRATTLAVPGDFSAAAFLLAGAALTPGARVTAHHVGLNPTRTALLRALERMGAEVEESRTRTEGGEPIGDVTVTGPERLSPIDLPAEWVPAMVDEIPAWAMAAAVAPGRSTLRGAGELRVKESDRLAALARGLTVLGIDVEENPDGLSIHGGAPRGGDVDALGDHRIAMAFAVLGTRCRTPLSVRGAGEIATSFPDFLAELRALGGQARAPLEDALSA